MAGAGSVLDSMIEILDSVTLTENAYDITFQSDNREGTYYVLSNPPMTSERASQQTQLQSPYSINYTLTGISTKTVRNAVTMLMYKSPSDRLLDWWAPGVTLGDGTVNVQLIGNRQQYAYLSGFTYYLLRVKGT